MRTQPSCLPDCCPPRPQQRTRLSSTQGPSTETKPPKLCVFHSNRSPVHACSSHCPSPDPRSGAAAARSQAHRAPGSLVPCYRPSRPPLALLLLQTRTGMVWGQGGPRPSPSALSPSSPRGAWRRRQAREAFMTFVDERTQFG